MTRRRDCRRAATRHWWQGAVIYQIYVRSFADSNGDGVGDLRESGRGSIISPRRSVSMPSG